MAGSCGVNNVHRMATSGLDLFPSVPTVVDAAAPSCEVYEAVVHVSTFNGIIAAMQFGIGFPQLSEWLNWTN